MHCFILILRQMVARIKAEKRLQIPAQTQEQPQLSIVPAHDPNVPSALARWMKDISGMRGFVRNPPFYLVARTGIAPVFQP